jgi:glycine dehydrogenase subunit 1
LCALRALIHLCLLGPQGLAGAARRSIELAHYAADKITRLPKVSLLNDAPFCNEFAVRLPGKAANAVRELSGKGILPGALPGLWYEGLDSVLLVACTEKNNEDQIDSLVKALEKII